MPLIYYKPDGSWTCGSCGRGHASGVIGCECQNPRAVEEAEGATDAELATARRIVEDVPRHGWVTVPSRLLARIVKRAGEIKVRESAPPAEKQERVEAATAQLLIEIAFLLPRGTDMRKHPIAESLIKFTEAVKAASAAPGVSVEAVQRLVTDIRSQSARRYADAERLRHIGETEQAKTREARADENRAAADALAALLPVGSPEP